MIDDQRYLDARAQLQLLCHENAHIEEKVRRSLQKVVIVLRDGVSSVTPAINNERKAIEDRLRGFCYEKSEPYHFFKCRGWNTLRFPVLVQICVSIAEKANVTIDREAKRRKQVLFKWLSEHWPELEESAIRWKPTLLLPE
jgi:hypothetical protein